MNDQRTPPTPRLPGPTWAWYALAAGIVTLWLYRAFVFDGGAMLFGQEMIDQSWQLREFGVEEIKAGRGVPLWNPYVFGGVPFVAILPGPVFYPTTALYFVMPLFRAIGWTFVLHTWLAGLFAYFAARSMPLSRPASAVTGFAFMLTGFVTSMNHAGHDGRMFTMVLIPLAFGMLERGLQTRRIGWFLGMGLVVACQIFTPHVQLMYFSSLALALYALVRVIWIWRDSDDWRPAARTFGFFAVGFATAAAVGMAQLLPTLDLLGIAVRGGGETGYAFASSWAMPPQELTGLVLPDLIGSLGTYWGTNPFKQHTEYVGVVTASLAVIGLTAVGRDRRIGLVAGIALLCLLFALGAATPVHRIAYEVVPMIRRFRAASMMLGPFCFFSALLAGYGWQRVRDARDADGALPWAWIIGLSAPALLLGLAAAFSPEGLVRWVHTSWFPVGWSGRPTAEAIALLRAGGWLLLGLWGTTWAVSYGVSRARLPSIAVVGLLALLVLDLLRVDARYVEVIDPEVAFAADPMVTALRNEMDPLARAFPLPEAGGYGPNDLMLHDIRSITGMQNFRLRWTERLLGGLSYRNAVAPALWPTLDLDYVITRQEVETPLLEPGPSGPRGTAWRVAAASSHAWFPARVEPEPDSATALRVLTSRADPVDVALVAVEPGSPGSVAADALPAAGKGTAQVTSFAPNEVVLDVDAAAPGLLVVSEIYHPDWYATIDGEAAPVHRVDIALRGVEVPAGRHEVRFHYAAGAVRTGLLVGLAALLAALAGIAWSARPAARSTASGHDDARNPDPATA